MALHGLRRVGNMASCGTASSDEQSLPTSCVGELRYNGAVDQGTTRGCAFVPTVVSMVSGPGSDSYHRMRRHLDLDVRGSRGDTKHRR